MTLTCCLLGDLTYGRHLLSLSIKEACHQWQVQCKAHGTPASLLEEGFAAPQSVLRVARDLYISTGEWLPGPLVCFRDGWSGAETMPGHRTSDKDRMIEED